MKTLIEYHVVTSRGALARTFDSLDLASTFQAQNPKWSILEVTVTSKDVTPLLLDQEA